MQQDWMQAYWDSIDVDDVDAEDAPDLFDGFPREVETWEQISARVHADIASDLRDL